MCPVAISYASDDAISGRRLCHPTSFAASRLRISYDAQNDRGRRRPYIAATWAARRSIAIKRGSTATKSDQLLGVVIDGDRSGMWVDVVGESVIIGSILDAWCRGPARLMRHRLRMARVTMTRAIFY